MENSGIRTHINALIIRPIMISAVININPDCSSALPSNIPIGLAWKPTIVREH